MSWLIHFLFNDQIYITQLMPSFKVNSNWKILVGEPKSRIVQKLTFFAPERYTAGILNTDSLNSA